MATVDDKALRATRGGQDKQTVIRDNTGHE
jgi:hypothetical protein